MRGHRPPAQARPGPSAAPSALVPSLQQKTTESIRSITTQSIKLDRTPRIISSNRWCALGRHGNINPAGASAFAEQAGCTDVSKEGVYLGTCRGRCPQSALRRPPYWQVPEWG